MVTHYSALAWEIPWTEEPGRVHGVAKESDMTELVNNNNSLVSTVERKGAGKSVTGIYCSTSVLD